MKIPLATCVTQEFLYEVLVTCPSTPGTPVPGLRLRNRTCCGGFGKGMNMLLTGFIKPTMRACSCTLLNWPMIKTRQPIWCRNCLFTCGTKENKELLTYLLFDSENEGYYIESIQDEMREAFNELISKPRYLRQKLLRKLLRNLKKYIRYSGRKETEIELLIEFCFLIKRSSQDLLVDKIIYSIYHKQLEIVKKRLNQLHEDLQLDYQEQLNELLS